MIQSRFSSNGPVAFEFELPADILPNKSTIRVSQILINFVTPPTDSSTVQLCFADDAGEDLIWEVDTKNKKHCAYAPNILIPVSKGAKRILRYANPESVRGTTRFLWQT